MNRPGRERVWAGGDKPDKIVTFSDVTLIPQQFYLYLYKVQRDGVLLGDEGIQKGETRERGREQEGEAE